MSATMIPTSDDPSDDLSALAWVQDELRRSLDAAHKALRRFVKETEALGETDVDAVDPSVLRVARSQIHQGVGALELVGQPAAAMMLRATEALVQRFVAKPHKLTSLVVDDIERASFALLDYLSRLLANKQVSTLSLFPQYRAVQEAAGADRVHPADLWAIDWQWRELPADPTATARPHDAATHTAIESQLLALMKSKSPLKAAARMSDICAGLGAGADQVQVATLWKLAAAVFEAQALGHLGFDVFSKRMASRLFAQYRILERGETDVSERLAQDLLFFCAQSDSPGDGRSSPRLAAARLAYGLAHHVPTDYSVSVLGKFDPAVIAQARKRVLAAKEAWSAIAGGEMHRMTGLSEQFALVGESVKKLFPHGDSFAAELQQAVGQTQQSNSAPPAPLAMEVATSLLYVEAALEDADFDNPDQAGRVKRLAERLAAVRQGITPEPLEAWMEELYRRVSDRQTMGSVVQELRASLSESEKLIDQYFRDPTQRDVLIPVPNQLSAMRGVLSVLGMDHASHALLRMRDEVDGLASTEVDASRVAQTGVFDRLAGNLGALGFLIDMLSVQPQMAKSLFTYDAAAGTLNPVMGRNATHAPTPTRGQVANPPVEQRLIEQAQMLAFSSVREDVPVADVSRDLERLSQEAQAADQPALAAAVLKAQEAIELAGDDAAGHSAARGELSEALVDFVATASDPVGLDAGPSVPGAHVSAPMKLDFAPSTASAQLAQDDEMREVFLEEAGEVLGDATRALADLKHAPEDLGVLTTLRRAFHTLKGSSRMVGLKDFGEAAWACEQLYNTQLADPSAAPSSLIEFTDWCLSYLSAWVGEISARRSGEHDSATVIAASKLVGSPQQPVVLETERISRMGALDTEPAPEMVVDEIMLDLPPDAAQAPEPEDAEPVHATGSDPFAISQPMSLGFPPELPSAADLDLIPAQQPSRPPVDQSDLPVLSFELNLANLEPGLAAGVSASAPLDMSSPALQEAFDPEPTVVLPAPEVHESDDLHEFDESQARHTELLAPQAGANSGLLDLDLGIEPVHERTAILERIEISAADAQAAEAVDLALPMADASESTEEHFKSVGPLRISIPLFNIYLNEADELSRRLTTEVAEWAMELHRPIGETPIALAHSLAGSSATVGFADLSHLARLLEHAEMRSLAIGHGSPDEAKLFVDAAEEIRRLLHQFAAGFLKEPSPELLARLAEHELSSSRQLDAIASESEPMPIADEVDETPQYAPEPEPRISMPASFGNTGMAGLDPLDSKFGGSFEPLGVAELKPFGDLPVEAPRAASSGHSLVDADDVIDAVDAIDEELFPIFAEEAEELLPQLASRLRDWVKKPGESAHPAACMRTLHTLKGGARLAGAMRLGEMAHRLETRIERLLATPPISTADVETLQIYGDGLSQTFDSLRAGGTPEDTQTVRVPAFATAYAATPAAAPEHPPVIVSKMAADLPPVAPAAVDAEAEAAPVAALLKPTPTPAEEPAEIDSFAAPTTPIPLESDEVETHAHSARAIPAIEPISFPPAAPAVPLAEIDWTRFPLTAPAERKAPERSQTSQSAVRVRAPLLDRLVNQAGEVSITRSRIETGVSQIKNSLTDLTENLERLRHQLRDIEFHGEVQMTSRLEAAKAASQSFDPLEFDRFTRFQELTRMMAESVNDVATVQRTLQRSLETTEDELVAQARMTRELQDDLLRTRMVEFEGLSDRLYRVVRQAAKETGKSVRLDIVGGSIEVDRGVLDRMTGSFEHLLRNCVGHGIETPDVRLAAGKEATGSIIVALSQEGNEVGVEFRDDGAGLNLPRIREKGRALGLIEAGAEPTDAELANLIFAPGFSTADTVTELAGRGVGMDVVRSEVNAMGGRVETATAAGQGTSFKMILPLTTAVTQVVMLRCGDTNVAVPSTLVEIVRRATAAEVDEAYATGSYVVTDRPLQFFWLGALLQISARPGESESRTRSIVVIRSAQQRIVLHVDEVLGNQEVVVKNLGPQLSRLPGLAGITLLASGQVALIYNPVALATLYGDAARSATLSAMRAPNAIDATPIHREPEAPEAPLVMVVDDSLTVRRVTQRLLLREGYRVVLAKDGLDALERLSEGLPAIVLSDIEMPRMDGFDLVRNMRADARLRELPVIMITSRIAQKHRDYAAELGVDHYLGKPYSEEDLLALIGRYTRAHETA